ncbi:MAG TPA: quinone-dependent dihydroorotate dehydrogenase [Thermodesulfobacteriota bacterium]|nr:quinone-dependent dihydroorotate dehydrogenase [Thermodesulfobacteriota bacterium]
MLYERLLRPALFAFDAETVHERTLALLARAGPLLRRLRPWLGVDAPTLARTVWGLRFPNPVGLAAGFDKQGCCLDAWEGLGFGFVEIGTVTARPQPGNPRPRLFRLPADRALINRLGFNSDGAAAVAARLKAAGPRPIPVGVNIGLSRAATLEGAAADYEASFEQLAPVADYVAVNVSSPNTPGLRELQAPEALGSLLRRLAAANRRLGPGRSGRPRPLLVKLSPDLAPAELEAAVGAAVGAGVDGFIATNTTTSRAGLTHPSPEEGGVSGRPLAPLARHVVAEVRRLTGGRVPVVGVGGLFTAEDVRAMFDAGATLVQLYTGLVYGGPLTVRRICRGLLRDGAPRPGGRA